MEFVAYLLLIPSFIWILFHVFKRNSLSSSSRQLPPGPFPLPIIGNFHQLGTKPYITLANLAKTYGPLMHVRFGSRPTVIVSSPEMAREVLMKHDLACSGRLAPFVTEALNHHEFSMGTLPVGTKWRTLRRACREHIFTTQKMEATEGLRQKKLRQLRDYLEDCSRSSTAVDIGEAVMVTSLNLLSNTIFSMDFAAYGTTGAQEIREAITQAMEAGSTPNPADYFPFLKRFDPKGLKRKTQASYTKVLGILDGIVSKRMEVRNMPSSRKKEDLLEGLLELNQQNELTLNDISHLLLDLVLGGGDSTSNLMQWVMVELLRDPKKMSKAKKELRTVVGENRQVVEADIPKLSYLSAMIKETFRYWPGAPFLFAHKAEEDMEINGYTIPKGASILVNIYAIGRDQRVWPNPDSFDPERFLGNNIDYRGQYFELIPFGSGRRICPGMPLVHLTSHLLVAHMIHNFDWKMKQQDVDLNGKDGTLIHMSTRIKAIPVKKT